jgi:cysteine desulfurase
MDRRIYLDHAATTPVDPRVVDAMLPYLTTYWGNPSSIYQEAREARKGLDTARRALAAILGARPAEIVFTGCGSDADNLAIRGVVAATRTRGNHVITSQIEHHAVLHTVQALEREGAIRATYLPVDGEGFVDLEALERAVTDETVLVSIMYANNEVGTIQPIAEIARTVKRRNPRTFVHTDAVQAAGALDLSVDRLGVDLLAIAAHKFYGPKGVGALYVRGRTPLAPQLLGGSQERDRRAGTENVAGAVGMATALRLACDEFGVRNAHSARLRDRLLDGIPDRVPDVLINGPRDRAHRISNNVNLCFRGIEAEPLLMQLDMSGVAASSGSACTSASLEPSHVLTAMGIPAAVARGSLRLSPGKETNDADVDYVLDVLPRFVARLRGLSSHDQREPIIADVTI